MDQDIKRIVKEYIEDEFIRDNAVAIYENSGLLSEGYIDSITTLQLVDFLEKTFNIEFEAHEVDRDNLDTLVHIEAFVKSKK